MFHFLKDTTKISRYFISPGVCEQSDGKFKSAVSLKSGQGSLAQDTVYTFSKLFATAQEATDHARHEGIHLALMK
jgi:hypothetical protein